MSTIAEQPARRAFDSFTGGVPIALAALAVTGIGFWKTFFSQLGNIDAAHMWHGASSTGWLLLVLVQASLIGSRQFKWHRALGWLSLLLFAVLLVSSWHVLVLLLSGQTHVPFEFAKLFAFSDVTAVPLLVVSYAGAIILRKDRHVHSRLMAVTLLAGLLPALARMFNKIWNGPDGLIFSMHPTYIFVLVILAIAIFADWRKGRLRWPFPFAFAWFAISYATLFPGTYSRWFDHLAKAIGATV